VDSCKTNILLIQETMGGACIVVKDLENCFWEWEFIFVHSTGFFGDLISSEEKGVLDVSILFFIQF